VQRKLDRFIGGPFDDDDGRGGPGGWWILLEIDVRLGLGLRGDLAQQRRPGSRHQARALRFVSA
jgi:hypothetical protein